jgi:predicted ribosomally synthesized peptide with SipW-like signal peptide
MRKITMKNKKIFAAAASVVVLGAVCVGSTLAYFTDTEAATNVLTIGRVDIAIEEPKFSEANENNTITDVVPDQEIYKDPRIKVQIDSEDCYVRAALEIDGLEDEQIEALVKNINIDSAKWVLGDGGYYYYQDVLTALDEIEFFTTVTIPAEWGNKISGKTFTIDVKAEAIQADYFTPETDNDGKINGWHGVTAERAR